MCSFSKILATGLRAGWIQARPEFAEPLTRVRFDMGTSPLVHYAIEYLNEPGCNLPGPSINSIFSDFMKNLKNYLINGINY